MKKNVKHKIGIANTRNDLADLVNNQETVIELKWQVYKELKDEIKKSIEADRKKSKSGKWDFAVTALMLVSGAYILGAVWGIFSLLGNIKGDYKKYMIAVLPGERLILIHKYAFDCELDTISGLEQYTFVQGKSCPKCATTVKGVKKARKTGNVSCRCSKCNSNLIVCI